VRSRKQDSRSPPERVIERGDLHCCEQACQSGLPGAVAPNLPNDPRMSVTVRG
jgi:hypothetical protein